MAEVQAPNQFEAIERIDGRPAAGVLLLCDHASNALPQSYGTLGLPAADLEAHIAYDIGAADITRRLAAQLGAPALLTRFSRLLIDPNRGAQDPTLVMRLSDRRLIPGNARIDAAEVARRRALYWQPYRTAVAETIAALMAKGPSPAVISVHTFTPRLARHGTALADRHSMGRRSAPAAAADRSAARPRPHRRRQRAL